MGEWVSSERCVIVNDVLLCGGFVISPLSQTSPPTFQARNLSSHYSVTWNHRAKKPNQLRLLNECNFLPESTRRAQTSIATLNYRTLIQINKDQHHLDCATPQRQHIYIIVWRQHLPLYTKKTESIISFKTGDNQNKSRGPDLCQCHYTMNYTQSVMKISI